jgi:hypothetical protein
MALAPYSYPIRVILEACKTTIVAGVVEYATLLDIDTLSIDASKVFISFTPDKMRGVAENHITIRVEPPNLNTLAGSARQGCRTKRPLVVTIFTRQSLDAVPQDDIWYANAAIGHYLFEDSVINCFHDRFLFELGEETPLTQTPVHWLPGVTPAQRPTPDNSWGSSSLVFELDYIQPMDTAYNVEA